MKLALSETPRTGFVASRPYEDFIHKIAKMLIGQPRDALPDLRDFCSHRYKTVFYNPLHIYLVLGGPQHHTIRILLIYKTENRLAFVAIFQ